MVSLLQSCLIFLSIYIILLFPFIEFGNFGFKKIDINLNFFSKVSPVRFITLFNGFIVSISGNIPNAHLPLQYKQPRSNMSRHTQRQLVAGFNYLEGFAVDLFPTYRLQSRWASDQNITCYCVPVACPGSHKQ